MHSSINSLLRLVTRSHAHTAAQAIQSSRAGVCVGWSAWVKDVLVLYPARDFSKGEQVFASSCWLREWDSEARCPEGARILEVLVTPLYRDSKRIALVGDPTTDLWARIRVVWE